MATLEDLEARLERLEWQARSIGSMLPEKSEMTLGQFILANDIAQAEFGALGAVFDTYDAMETFAKDDLSNDLLATMTEHPGITAEDIIRSFFYGNRHYKTCDKWFKL